MVFRLQQDRAMEFVSNFIPVMGYFLIILAMGQIPAKTKMMSSIITFPLAGSATIQSDKTFNITVQMSNITPGSFSNAASTYFSAPQQLDSSGVSSLIFEF